MLLLDNFPNRFPLIAKACRRLWSFTSKLTSGRVFTTWTDRHISRSQLHYIYSHVHTRVVLVVLVDHISTCCSVHSFKTQVPVPGTSRTGRANATIVLLLLLLVGFIMRT